MAVKCALLKAEKVQKNIYNNGISYIFNITTILKIEEIQTRIKSIVDHTIWPEIPPTCHFSGHILWNDVPFK